MCVRCETLSTHANSHATNPHIRSYVSINRKMHKTSFDDKVRAPRKEDTPRLAVMQRKQAEGKDPEYTVTPHRGDWDKSSVESFLTEIAVKGGTNKDSSVSTRPSTVSENHFLGKGLFFYHVRN
jgi:hypothetical protein